MSSGRDPTATDVSLLLHVAALSGLAGCPDVDAMAERVCAAVRGNEGLDRWDVERLQRWVRRWSLVAPEVRVFYRRGLDAVLSDGNRRALEFGIRCLIDGGEPSSQTTSRLDRLHLDLMACSSGRDLARLAR